MRLETLALLKAWLSDGTYGVNAQLANVPRLGADALPANFALIADAGHNAFAARRQIPDRSSEVPCLLVGLGKSARLDPHSAVGKRDGLVEVTLTYFAVEPASEVGVQEAEYRFRAIERALDDWFVNGTDSDRRSGSPTNTAVLYIEQPLAVVEPFVPIQDALIGGEMTVVFKVRDTVP